MKSRATFLGGTLAACAFPLAAGAQSQYAQTTTLAIVAPFSGAARGVGEQLASGITAALDDANRTRFPTDRIFALRTLDDRNDTTSGLLNARFATDDINISGVIGHGSARVTEAALRAYADAQMPLIVPSTSADVITSHGYRSVFRLPTRDSLEGQLHAKFALSEKRGSRSVVVTQDGAYGADFAVGFTQQARADRLSAETVTLRSERPDFGVAAQSIISFAPDLVVLCGLASDLGPLIPSLRAAGYVRNIDASQGFFDGSIAATYGKDVEGIVVSSPMPPLNLAASALRIKTDYEQRNGGFTPLSAFGYAAAQIFVAATRRSITAQRITIARSIAFPIPFDTVVGSYTFDAAGEPRDPNVYFYSLAGGRWSYVRAAHPSSYIFR